jgi:hypothetical protein
MTRGRAGAAGISEECRREGIDGEAIDSMGCLQRFMSLQLGPKRRTRHVR